MSTRCMIGMEAERGGAVRAVYCHHDGYHDGVGGVLLASYRDAGRISPILDLGDLSSLGNDEGSTEAYHRDRGEDLCPAREYSDAGAYFDDHGNEGDEYRYLLRLSGEPPEWRWSVAIGGDRTVDRTVDLALVDELESLTKDLPGNLGDDLLTFASENDPQRALAAARILAGKEGEAGKR